MVVLLVTLVEASCNSGAVQSDDSIRVDISVADDLPEQDRTSMWMEPSLPSSVVLASNGGGARYLRDYLVIRPRDEASLEEFLARYPFLSREAPLVFASVRGPVSYPFPDRTLNVDGSVTEAHLDVIARVDWGAVSSEEFANTKLGLSPDIVFTVDSPQAKTLLQMSIKLRAADSSKVVAVHPVPLVVRTPPEPRVLALGPGDEDFCPCVDAESDPDVYVSTRFLPLDPKRWINCGARALLSGYNLLTLREATVSKDAELFNDAENIRMWVIPEKDFPVHLPGGIIPLGAKVNPDDQFLDGPYLSFGKSGQFEGMVPPHARSTSLRGPLRADDQDFCEWSAGALPSTLRYTNHGMWEWSTESADERVGVLTYESDEGGCFLFICAGLADDLLDVAFIKRGDTLDGPRTYGENGVSLTVESVAVCRNDPGEVCDGLDNDCDGDVDEADPALGQPCDPGYPICKAGQYVCDGDGQLHCVGAIEKQLEICNGADDDCDGATDEDDPQLGDLCGLSIGECQTGVLVCSAGILKCQGETLPSLETCGNHLDDDCDGSTDEAPCACEPGSVRPCGFAIGECSGGDQTCQLGVWGPCEGAKGPIAEICGDGKDNDCNLAVDENCGCNPGDSKPCGIDINPCQAGKQTCVGGLWTDCVGAIAPQLDVCDGNDNDCDGNIDDPCPCVKGSKLDCGDDEGECTKGVQLCEAAGWTECDGLGPSTELCDTKDNDCNGATDEGLLNACGECGPVPIEICDVVDNDCDGNLNEGVLNKCGQCGPEPAEVCDDKDNDCDGAVDEGVSDCGLVVVQKTFELSGETSEIYEVNKPPGYTQTAALIFFDSYWTAADDDYEFRSTCSDLGAKYSCTIITKDKGAPAFVKGRIVVLGVGINGSLSGLQSSWKLPFNTCGASQGPFSVPKGTTVPVGAIRSLWNSTDDYFQYTLTPKVLGKGSVGWDGCVKNGNKNSYIEAVVGAIGVPLSIPETDIKVIDQWIHTEPVLIVWPGKKGTIVPLLSVVALENGGDADVAWSLNCSQAGENFVCQADTKYGDPDTSKIRIRGVLLRLP